jgi:hypothetical protein
MVGFHETKVRAGLTARLGDLAVESQHPAGEVIQPVGLLKPCVILRPRKRPVQNV